MKLLKTMPLWLSGMIVLAASYEAAACVGARAMGRGGAFIAVSDDVSGVYWNPAGLGRISGMEASYTRTMSGRDRINYDDFIAFAGYSEDINIGYGLSYIGESLGNLSGAWYSASVGAELTENFYAGGNLKINTVSADEAGNSDSDSCFAIDISALYEITDKITAGILIQNLNEPEFEIFNQESTWVRNIRPGIAYQVTDSINVALDFYDLTDEAELEGDRFMVGAEYKMPFVTDVIEDFDMFTLRTGYYMESYTFGIGLEAGDFKLDYAFLGDSLANSRQVGLTYLF